jgi:tetratricopeptide (TPR) repeat protein
LAGLLWGKIDEDRARYNLRRALWSLRREINPPHSTHDVYVRFEEGCYSFNPLSDHWLDVAAFEETVDSNIPHSANSYSDPTHVFPPANEQFLSNAVDFYCGDFMAGFRLSDCPAYEDWMYLERDRLRLLYLKALQSLARACTQRRDYWPAIAYCQEILSADPTYEAAHRELMVIYHTIGNQESALQQYQLLSQTLRSQLDLEPLPETRSLYQSIRHGTLPAKGLTYSLTQSSDWAMTSYLPFVGRVGEQSSLDEALESAIQGRSAVVAISGEAGVGKTRLVKEFLGHTSVSGLAILRARCYLQDEALPYQAIIDALRAYLPAVDPAHLARLDDLWVAEVVKLLPELHGYLSHVPVSPTLFPEQERNRLFEGMAQFITHLSQRSSLVLFLDDLHFADEPTLEMVHYLARRLAGTRVLLIITLRQEELVGHPGLRNLLRSLKRIESLMAISLDRLTADDVFILVREALPEETDLRHLARSLYEESGGNPFYLVELLRSLQEDGRLSPDELPIPTSVRQVIQGRLLRLDDKSRKALNAASVIGRQFDSIILRQVYPDQEEALLDALDRLLAQHWVEQLPGARPGLYDFSHGLVREVVYQLMPSDWRRRLHRKVGLAMESSGDSEGELAGSLTYHFREGGDLERAQRYALFAAAYARKLYANREAIGYYLRALELSQAGGSPLITSQYLEILLELGKVYQLLGEYEAAIATCRQVLTEEALNDQTAGETLADPVSRQLCLQLALAYDRKGEYQQALAALRLLEIHTSYSNDPEMQLEKATAAWAMARVRIHRGQNYQALALCNKALTLLSRLSWSEALATIQISIYHSMARSYFHLGNYDIAVRHYERALEIAGRLNQRATIPRLLIGLGDVARRRGDYAQAEAYARESLSMCQEVGHVAGVATSHGALGNVAYNRGRLVEAFAHYQQALSTFRQLGDRRGVADSCLSAAFVLFDQGKIDAAETYLAEAYQIGQAIDADLVMIRAHYHLAKVSQAQDDLNQAQVSVETAIELAERAGIQLMKALGYRLLGEILAQRRKLVQAESHMLESLRLLEKLGERFEVSWALRSYARLLASRSEPTRAQALLRQAALIFGELEAERELEKTNEELSHLQSMK